MNRYKLHVQLIKSRGIFDKKYQNFRTYISDINSDIRITNSNIFIIFRNIKDIVYNDNVATLINENISKKS